MNSPDPYSFPKNKSPSWPASVPATHEHPSLIGRAHRATLGGELSRPPNQNSPWPGLTRPPSARASASANHQSALSRLIHRADARWLGGRVKPGHGEVGGLLSLPKQTP